MGDPTKVVLYVAKQAIKLALKVPLKLSKARTTKAKEVAKIQPETPVSRPVRSRRGRVARIIREPTLEEVSKDKDKDKAKDNVKEDTALFNKSELSDLLEEDEENEESAKFAFL